MHRNGLKSIYDYIQTVDSHEKLLGWIANTGMMIQGELWWFDVINQALAS